jgi:ATP-dependent DNA helicase DinG
MEDASQTRPAREALLQSLAARTLGKDGPFVEQIDDFNPREGQQELAGLIEHAIDQDEDVIAEAGTGTGKTYAYLVPVVQSGRKALLSTGTKNLQEQLYARDLPRVQKTLGMARDVALLKGRANYLCQYRYEQAEHMPRFSQGVLAGQLKSVRQFARSTRHGDLEQLADLPRDSQLYPFVSSTVDNCLGQECPLYGDCFVVQARRRAQEADIVVVNHHLLFADMAIKQDGFGEVLPNSEVVVIDEAHQAPGVATQFFTEGASTRQLLDWLRDIRMEAGTVSAAQATLADTCGRCETRVRELILSSSEAPERGGRERLMELAGVEEALVELIAQMDGTIAVLADQAERSEGLTACWQRGQMLVSRLKKALEGGDEGNVVWFERTPQHLILQVTPLDVADALRKYRARQQASWVFTSATLAVNQSFTHFARQLGLSQETLGLQLDSPFNYPEHGVFLLPKGLPDPRDSFFTDRLVDTVLPILRASKGRAFLLFTSHRARLRAAERLEQEGGFKLFLQGDQPPAELIAAFSQTENALLLASAGFWEGVDVPGDALSVVIIDKLPFAPPDDPVTEARAAALEAQGLSSFAHMSLPQAIIRMKQGAGRLIRSERDRGVLVVGDERLVSKGYGRQFINSLPPMRRTRSLQRVLHFLQQLEQGDEPTVSD